MPKLCSRCNITYQDKVNYCTECGKLLQVKTCHRCHETLDKNYKFCPNCGLKLRFFCSNCNQEYFEGQSKCFQCNKTLSIPIQENEQDHKEQTKEKEVLINIDENKNEENLKEIKEDIQKIEKIFVEPKKDLHVESNEKTLVSTEINKSKPLAILPNVKAQLENQARQTELNLQMLKWVSHPLSFRNDNFLSDIKDSMNTNKFQKQVKKPWDKYLQFYRREDYFRSVEELIHILQILPDNMDVLINIAICYRHMGDIKKVFDFLVRSRSVKPDDKGVLNELLGVSSLLRYWKTFMETLRAYYAVAKKEDQQSHLIFEYELRFGFYQNALEILNDMLLLDIHSFQKSIPDYLTLMAIRCLNDQDYSKFHRLISNQSLPI